MEKKKKHKEWQGDGWTDKKRVTENNFGEREADRHIQMHRQTDRKRWTDWERDRERHYVSKREKDTHRGREACFIEKDNNKLKREREGE